MRFSLRKVTTTLVATLALTLGACSSESLDYPARKIEIVVGYGAGSANDVVARAFAAGFEEVSGANVLVVNRPGAAGIVASTEAMMGAADGYHLLLAPISAFTNAPLMQKVHYSAEDFRTVASLAEQPFAIAVKKDAPYDSLADLANAPRALTYATLGIGHASHVLMAEILHDVGATGRTVPFEGGGLVVQSTVSGETDIAVANSSSVIERVRSGELKALAVTGTERVEELPDVPTVHEAGFPQADYLVSQALAVPADTPEDVVARLEELSAAALETDTYQAFLKASNNRVPAMSGVEWMRDYAPNEMNRLATAYEELGILK